MKKKKKKQNNTHLKNILNLVKKGKPVAFALSISPLP